jgi:hypothetical protein
MKRDTLEKKEIMDLQMPMWVVQHGRNKEDINYHVLTIIHGGIGFQSVYNFMYVIGSESLAVGSSLE